MLSKTLPHKQQRQAALSLSCHSRPVQRPGVAVVLRMLRKASSFLAMQI